LPKNCCSAAAFALQEQTDLSSLSLGGLRELRRELSPTTHVRGFLNPVGLSESKSSVKCYQDKQKHDCASEHDKRRF
jgi:hypothetical protein